ncbi:CinA family nicotinamide mononucleotide deamidase-related protein [Paramuribaculum intestinale]|jgi:nicotinamide-nucleotide amidase|uniref:CinA-like protein n=3 Tax=Paramuribaculum intestinale TaxID=2094151 RepID=A0A2V1IWB1_9BACT|nr:CinA family nicotinamide mononucleotide deamidase-related protein [Paramuribaculum intestinale]MBJ2186974.1 CinA family nicotinamide mononucleotide deamidase-related protein [Muribaculaceae bacterium]ROS93168.1 CinA family nicotinamide mononucleotide deamidase-related protein [Muribaculaceae bacterium Isolate-043 (Harlan)]MCX4329287.1 CinA family nicotinamide mononucleotide deamidase-related protein [Paramuribaculum intestinale]PWB08200.1 nicotinamide-nucleotide amidohydrolase family protein
MKTTIIVIGDELLIGQVTDTNSGMIARLMAPHGWEVEQVMTVADDREAIREAVGRALDSTPVVLTTGGLGPTKDDITKAVLTDIFGGELREDPDVLANVREVVERRGLKLNDLTAAQAIVPTSCRVIQNRVGTAPLMWFERTDGHILVAMPGVPFETREMFSSAVMPMLLQRFPSPDHIEHRTLVLADISESALATRLAPWESALPPYAHLAYLPKPGVVRLRIDGRHTDAGFLKKEIDRLADELALLAAGNLMCRGDITPARCLLDMLVERHLTVGTAESCTGGNIAHTITAEPGSSAAMLGGVVSYSNDVKRRLLEVSEASLEAHGAVSIPVVKEMASGARKALGCDIALATSGIAGPGGAVPGKPVGTVCIAVATPWGLWADTFHFPGNRERVIDRATTTAIIRAIRELQSHP